MSDELDERLEERAHTIVTRLAETGRDRAKPLGSPEFRKNLDRLHTAIRDTQRLRRTGRLEPHHEAQLERLLLWPEDVTDLNSDALGMMLESIDQVLVDAGDDALLEDLLAIEYVRDRDERRGPVPTWSTVHDQARPTDLDDQKRRLAKLLRVRHSIYALRQAREGTRARRLLWLAPVLGALILVFIVVADTISDASWRVGIAVAVAGAMGATVAAGRKLRDALARLSGLRTFWSAFALQLAIGAVAGLFLWVVLESRFVDVGGPGDDWAVAVVLAFVAGFSEPFVLKTIERIAGRAEDDEDT